MSADKDLDMGMKCIKYMLFVANFMFILVGFLLISIGSTIKAIYSEYDYFMESHFFSASNLAIGIGITIFFVSIFGCIGAIRESVLLVNIYGLLLFSVLILEISACITSYVMRNNLEEQIRSNMEHSMKYYESNTKDVWDYAQLSLRCCGVDGPEDWTAYREMYTLNHIVSTSGNTTHYYIPNTCCSEENCSSEYRMYTKGCLTRISHIVSEGAFLLAIGALCVSLIQVLGVVFAYLLGKSIRRLKTQLTVNRMERRQHIYEQFAKEAQNEKSVSPVLYTPASSEA